MGWRSLRFKLVLVYTLLIVFAVELIGAYFVRALTTSLIHNQSVAAKSQAELMATLVGPQLETDSKHITSSITSVVESVPQFLSGTVYLLNSDGDVTYSSAGGALIGQKRTDTVTTQALIHHADAVSVRFDPFSKQHVLAVAVPVRQHQTFYGVLEYVLPIQSTYDTIRQVTTLFYTGSAVVLGLTIILGVILSRALTKPVLDVTRQARIMAAGDFSMRVEAESNDEIGDLVQAINHLADELDEALERNHLEQERLQAIITSMGDGVIVLNKSGDALFMNDAAGRMLRADGEMDVDPVAQLGLRDMTRQALDGHCTEVRVVDDTIYHIIMTSIERRDETDGFVAVVRDVTEQEHLNQARRDFVSNVSHELRTPLTSVKSYLEALRDLHDDEEQTRQTFLGVIEQETDRMVRLTRDLLQLSGLDRGQSYSVNQTISVAELLDQVEQRFAFQAGRQQLALTVEKLQDKTVFIRGNKDLVNRILDNLVSNALKYTPPGGHVFVEAEILPMEVAITVIDDGVGIPKEDLPHVFERFYRVDKGRSRRLGGSGLGLALAREITERLDGDIHIDSEPEVGTRVRVSLKRVWEVGHES
ncbi:ATP-binding protein [Alicyclobacillus dauci]|uniref:histidine kinase n=1 Tax=Alicyclobacillus dauci TaxID=1475485 RepID=A0ABY6Z2T0_9BACL|nr:ATP-binding protein [Alicyclobacillus dauci]WAH36982.1 cell wall metabolism sensor histidine kinase WalK [Alicyclobacillus dauci]